ncbi:MAG: zf-HC2 domain-containing protein [Desulfobacteraceae bacterium]|jgi:anti-sigma factor RsiW
MKKICGNDGLLSAYLDNELSDAERLQISGHLETCAKCRNQLAALQAADAMIRDADAIEPSATFDRSFWDKVASQERRKQPAWKQWLQPGWRPAMAVGLTAGIVMGLLIFADNRKAPSLEEMIISENIELLTEYDLIRHLDILENLDALEAMKERS